MKSADLQGLAAVPPAAANGSHRPGKKNGSGSKRGNGSAHAAEHTPDAPFLRTEAAPVDAGMWPLHLAMWFQPEPAPAAPEWSGLGIERRQRVPSSDFRRCDAAWVDCPAGPVQLQEVLAPAPDAAIPAGDLAPLGWDPRAVCRKEGSE
ncbi:MAG TPA: hypothetical protein VMJ75_01980 [Candidatus Acidoferrales bacterium]|nr:hypothetical protein [Candidatus Acidoferrales bacterium]